MWNGIGLAEEIHLLDATKIQCCEVRIENVGINSVVALLFFTQASAHFCFMYISLQHYKLGRKWSLKQKLKFRDTDLFVVVVIVNLLNCVWVFCNLMYYSLPDSSVHGISQARTLEWVAIFFSREGRPGTKPRSSILQVYYLLLRH